MRKFLFILIALFFVFINKAQAFDINYQRVNGVSGSDISVIISGTSGNNQFTKCSLENWFCDPVSSSSVNLYPDFSGRNFYVSPDSSLFLVQEKPNSTVDLPPVFSLYKKDDQNGLIKIKEISFSDAITNARIAADNKKIVFSTTANKFVVFDIDANKEIGSFDFDSGASFVTISSHANYIAYYKPNTLSTSDRAYTLIDVLHEKVYSWKYTNNYWDLLTEEDKAFDFSPDESQFVYLSDAKGYQTLYSVNLKKLVSVKNTSTELGVKVFKGNFTISSFLYSDSKYLYFIGNRENPLKWALYSYNLKTQMVNKISEDVAYWPGLVKVGNYVLFNKLGKNPSTIYALNLSSKAIKSLPLSVGINDIVQVGKVKQYGNVYSVLQKPDNFDIKKKYPLIVWLHGGPYRQTSISYHPYLSYGVYDDLMENLRKQGFVILKVDYRGSYGYGRKFAQDIMNSVGKSDVADVMTAVKGIKSEIKVTDTYLMGNSYGGYLSLKVLADNPKKFTGAISINGVSDWETLLTDIPSSIFSKQFNGSPNDGNKKLFDKASVYFNLENLLDKLVMLVYGQKDDTVPVAQTTDLYRDLSLNSTKVKLLTIPDEGHVIEKKNNLDNLLKGISEFLVK